MRLILTILLLTFLQTTFARVIQWKTKNESAVVNYEVQTSVDTLNWNTIDTIMPLRKDSNFYSYDVNLTQTIYVRVKANMLIGFYKTESALLVSDIQPVNIINATTSNNIFSDNLTWTTVHEESVASYSLEKSTDNGLTFSQFQQPKAKGAGDYKASTSRFFLFKKPQYRIVPINKDGTKGIPVKFK